MRAILLLMAFLSAGSAFAIDCPVKERGPDYIDNVGRAIKAAQSCEDGAAIAEACAFGASGDSAIAPVAERKCGLDFWQKLSAADRQVYNGLQARCDAKYKDMEGTMYISANAFCRLSGARLYSSLYRPAE
jgi:hypothetical protein